jgi:hypothetical protein
VLFAPELEERTGEPAPVRVQPVDDGMAGRAEGEEPGWSVDAGPAMVDGVLLGRSAGLAVVAVAGEHGLPVAGKGTVRVARAPVTAAAHVGLRGA